MTTFLPGNFVLSNWTRDAPKSVRRMSRWLAIHFSAFTLFKRPAKVVSIISLSYTLRLRQYITSVLIGPSSMHWDIWMCL